MFAKYVNADLSGIFKINFSLSVNIPNGYVRHSISYFCGSSMAGMWVNDFSQIGDAF